MAEASIECGFCCHKITEMNNPIKLPCGHVHCLGCIEGFYEEEKLIKCPEQDCGKVVAVSIESLPAYAENAKVCDICQTRKHKRVVAVSFCGSCETYYCQAHKVIHEENTLNHKITAISELPTETARVQEEKCPKHQDQMLSLGCRTCLQPYCAKCVSGLTTCKEGNPHKLMSLEEVVSELLTEDITKDMTRREVQLEGLFKQTSKAVSEHDEETEEGLNTLKKTRAEHLKEVKQKYDELEEEWVDRRGKQKVEMTDFLDEEVLRRWNQIRNEKELMESKLQQASQVGLLRDYQELVNKQKMIVSENLPQLVSSGSINLIFKGGQKEIKLELAPAEDVKIAADPTMLLPKQLIHHKTIELPAMPLSLYSQDGCLYVGMSNSKIARIDGSYNVDESFISCSGEVFIAVHEERFYTVLLEEGDGSRSSGSEDSNNGGGDHGVVDNSGDSVEDGEGDSDDESQVILAVCVYDKFGEKLDIWEGFRSFGVCPEVVVVGKDLVLGDPQQQKISVYSLSGELRRHVPCDLMSESSRFRCAVDDNSVIISDIYGHKVSRFNITTGSVEWSVSLDGSGGVCCYGSKYLLVEIDDFDQVTVIDVVTGCVISEIETDNLMADTLLPQMFGNYLVASALLSDTIELFKVISE